MSWLIFAISSYKIFLRTSDGSEKGVALMKRYFGVLLMFSILATMAGNAQMFDTLKRTVAFVFGRVHVKGPNGQFLSGPNGTPLLIDMPLGTAFFVIYPDERLEKEGLSDM